VCGHSTAPARPSSCAACVMRASRFPALPRVLRHPPISSALLTVRSATGPCASVFAPCAMRFKPCHTRPDASPAGRWVCAFNLGPCRVNSWASEPSFKNRPAGARPGGRSPATVPAKTSPPPQGSSSCAGGQGDNPCGAVRKAQRAGGRGGVRLCLIILANSPRIPI
jgi:hypothetical protein